MPQATRSGIKSTAIQSPTDDEKNHTTVLRQLKECVEIGQRLRGDDGDSFVRVKELVNAGIIRLVGGVVQPPTAGSGGGGGSTSPLTTKGDLWGYSSVDARVPVGTNGQVLTADSAETLGLKWATPSASGAGVAATTTVAGSAATSMTLTGLDLATDKSYMIDLSVLNATSTDTDLDMFMNADTTRTNYDHQLFIGDGGTPFTVRANTPRIMALGPAVGVLSTIRVFLSLQADGGVAAVVKGGRWRSGTGMVIWDTAWRWRTTGTNVTSITFTSVTANAIDVNSFARAYRCA